MAATASAIIGGISLATSVASGVKGKRDQEDAVQAAENLAAKQSQEAERLAGLQMKEDAFNAEIASKEGVKFGVENDEPTGSFNDFLISGTDLKKSKSLGGVTSSGLGFA